VLVDNQVESVIQRGISGIATACRRGIESHKEAQKAQNVFRYSFVLLVLLCGAI